MPQRDPKTLDALETETRFTGDGGTVGDDAAPQTLPAPALTVAGHPDLGRVGERVVLPELLSAAAAGRQALEGRAVELSRLAPRFAPPAGGDARPLAEPHLSRTPLGLHPDAGGGVVLRRNGSPTPTTVDGEELKDEARLGPTDLDRGVVLELGGRVVLVLDRHPTLTPDLPRFGLVGESRAMVRLRQDLRRAARLDVPVLLRGASGTGKELAARALHDHGPRRDRAFVSVNMAAIPPTLAASELFGARKGAYTGADRPKPGYFAAADGGTLFLDEIGDTPADVQPLLLRALEDGEIQPVGGAETRRVDVRVIAATDLDLERAVDEGAFRAPLLHRLAGWDVRLPTLAERRSDVGRLLVHFLRRELQDLGADPSRALPHTLPRTLPQGLPSALVARLVRHDWPGNVRQLRNVARRLAVTVTEAGADLRSLEAAVEPLLRTGSHTSAREATSAGDTQPAREPVAEPADAGSDEPGRSPSPTGRWRPVYRDPSSVGEEELRRALRRNGFDLKPTAEDLGVSRSSLYKLIDACDGVRTAAQLEAEEIEASLAEHEGDVEAAAAALEVSSQGLKMRLRALEREPT